MKGLCRTALLSAVLLLPSLRPPAAAAARAEIPPRTGSPYVGAIVVDAETGGTVFEENADAECYPASIVKLMDLLIILERVGAKSLDLQEPVTTTAETSRIGGSQVYLAENETFTVEELLYALMVQSANDAAVALALHVAGSTEGFVRLMQEKADKLGMTSTRFASVHGLPPDKGKEPDLSTPRDLAVLGRAVAACPGALAYTSTQVRGFRGDSFEMRNHNRLLGVFPGCDGLKTGYFRLGGYSVVATAARGGNRFIAVVAGAKEKKERDARAKALLASAFAKATPKPAATATAMPAPTAPPAVAPPVEKAAGRGRRLLLIAAAAALGWGVYWFVKTQIGGPPPEA